jgi:hypothetical protein
MENITFKIKNKLLKLLKQTIKQAHFKFTLMIYHNKNEK